jgi:hypothetical protein
MVQRADWVVLAGKVYKPLENVQKTKYLAVYPITDNFEQL